MNPKNCSSATRSVAEKYLARSLRWIRLRLKRLLPQRPLAIPHLPYEFFVDVIGLYVDSVVNTLHVRQYRLGEATSTQSQALTNIMLVSAPFGDLVCQEWNRYWPVLTPKRWLLARPIVFFELPFSLAVDLSPFIRLRYVSLPFNQAFEYRDGWRLLPFMAIFPPGLQQIEFLWCHASESEIIELVKRICPGITTLRIVPCTMFHNPECVWWGGHQGPEHHAHYMRDHEAENYAKSIALSLSELHIESLHLGVYFIPFEAVTIHRSEHAQYHPIEDSTRWIDGSQFQSVVQFNAAWAAKYPMIPPPDTNLPRLANQKLWTKPCPLCVNQWSEPLERAERLAASLLAVEHWSLKWISFGSFVGEKRTEPSEWEVCRSEVILPPSASTKSHTSPAKYPDGTKVKISSKRPGAPCSSRRFLTFRRSGTDWVVDQE